MDKLSPEKRAEIRAMAEDIRRRVMDPDYVSPYLVAEKEEPKKVKKSSPKSGVLKKTRVAGGFGGSKPRYDYKKIAELWSQGLCAAAICAEVGCGMSTVRTALKRTQPEGYTGKSGPRTLDVCQRGHDMSVHGKPISSGGRYCSQCKRDREREAWQQRKQKQKSKEAAA